MVPFKSPKFERNYHYIFTSNVTTRDVVHRYCLTSSIFLQPLRWLAVLA